MNKTYLYLFNNEDTKCLFKKHVIFQVNQVAVQVPLYNVLFCFRIAI